MIESSGLAETGSRSRSRRVVAREALDEVFQPPSHDETNITTLCELIVDAPLFIFMRIFFHIWDHVHETDGQYRYRYFAGDELIDWFQSFSLSIACRNQSELKPQLRVCALHYLLCFQISP